MTVVLGSTDHFPDASEIEVCLRIMHEVSYRRLQNGEKRRMAIACYQETVNCQETSKTNIAGEFKIWV